MNKPDLIYTVIVVNLLKINYSTSIVMFHFPLLRRIRVHLVFWNRAVAFPWLSMAMCKCDKHMVFFGVNANYQKHLLVPTDRHHLL